MLNFSGIYLSRCNTAYYAGQGGNLTLCYEVAEMFQNQLFYNMLTVILDFNLIILITPITRAMFSGRVNFIQE